MATTQDIKKILEAHPDLQEKLFARGFLLTSAAVDAAAYPFYGKWQGAKIGSYQLLVSPRQHYFIREMKDAHAVLVGHAYDPFAMESDENRMLERVLAAFNPTAVSEPKSDFWQSIHSLTGVFTLFLIEKDSIFVIGDASGMQTTFYLESAEQVYVASHTNLFGDLLNLQWDPYIEKLVHYRFFRLFGNSLPGNLTQYANVKRVVPNHYVRFAPDGIEVKRFYWPVSLPVPREEIVEQVAKLLRANLTLISQKWEKPAISLTGGCDSKTTLACANGLYDRFSYFSYIFSESEAVDAKAAQKICNALKLPHTIYRIPETDEALQNVEAAREILNWNTGNIRYSHPGEVRKRVFFADTEDFDVEVKSWASEIGRAYYSKRFAGRTSFGDSPTPRKCTTLYKFFFNNRKLVRQTDQAFGNYLNDYFNRGGGTSLPWQEQFFWEFRVASWNGLVITGEHRYAFDITIPYNNRRILELLLSAPIEDRIADRVYTEIRARENPFIDQTGIAVTNLKHTQKRAKAENLYYMLHSRLPF